MVGFLENELSGIVVADAAVRVSTDDTATVVNFDWLEENGCGGCGASSLPDLTIDEPSVTRFVCSEEGSRRGSQIVWNSCADKPTVEIGC